MAKKHFFTTENGVEVPIQAISLAELQLSIDGIRQEYQERGESLEPPTYQISLGPEGKAGFQEMPHDETTLKTDEDREAWAAYQDVLARFNKDQARTIQEAVFEDGLMAEIPADGAWEARMARKRIKVPEDAKERRDLYILTSLLKTAQDIKACIAEVMILSSKGMDNEAELKAALQSFRDPLQSGEFSGSGEAAGGS